MSKESRDVKYSPIHTQLRKLSARAGLPSFRAVGVSKRRTQAGTLVLRLMGRCVGLKRPCTGPCLEGRAKKDIPTLGPLGSVTNSHRALANGQERHLFKEVTCYPHFKPIVQDGCREGLYQIRHEIAAC